MAYMLSAQLAATELDVRYGFVDGGAKVYAPAASGADAHGFVTVTALMAEANAELALHPLTITAGPIRAHQAALKTALDRANNNRNFLQAGPETCPAPVF